jgi:hypothetical protein
MCVPLPLLYLAVHGSALFVSNQQRRLLESPLLESRAANLHPNELINLPLDFPNPIALLLRLHGS